MTHLSDRERQTLREMFRDLKYPVHVELFVDPEDEWSRAAEELITEVVGVMPDLLHAEVRPLREHQLLATLYGVERAPTFILCDHKRDDSGIRFVGLPSGYEFAVLIEALLDVSASRVRISDKSLNYIRNLEREITLEVFVTPTCPHCPRAVRLAHQLAWANPARVHAFAIESTKFATWADAEAVVAVPTTVIRIEGGTIREQVAGAVSEDQFVRLLKDIMGDGH